MIMSSITPYFYRVSLFTLAFCLLLLGGCNDGNPQRVAVEGKVLVDGEPLTRGSIMFVPEGGRPSSSRIASDGSFVLGCFHDNDGALLGVHKVAVIAKTIVSDSKVKWHAPRRYNNYMNSGLTVEVTEPIHDLVIELTTEDDKKRRS